MKQRTQQQRYLERKVAEMNERLLAHFDRAARRIERERRQQKLQALLEKRKERNDEP